MNKTTLNDTLTAVLMNALEQTAFMFGEPGDLTAGFSGDATSFVGVTVTFHGDHEGECSLITTTDFCEELAANMLGEDVEDEDHPEKQADAVKEILNIIAGRLLSEVYGAAAVINLSPPEMIAAAHDHFVAAIAQHPYSFCEVDGHPVGIVFKTTETADEH